MGPVRTNAPLTLLEILAFAGAVVGPAWGLAVLISSLYVAGTSFVVLLVPLAFHPAPLLVGVVSLSGVALLVTRVQGRWTRAEIALVSCGVVAVALWLAPVLLMGDAAAGTVIGLVLVVLAVAFGPLPVCFWSAMRTAGSMRVCATDPASPSWLREGWAWCLARYEAVRSRKEPTPDAADVPVSRTKAQRTEQG
ncbi:MULTISPECIES: hypothetical protein [Mumia]|uniref:hypothetical protein n=1 Tax=Mumia TaxID=1546255 RepID=UPI00141DF367|nr:MULTISPECIES: hypothetical protein [unclassified Mumia]QMW66982.1 hypothetical protein H4N58_03315 [Mumia sp. ZJ1417]